MRLSLSPARVRLLGGLRTVSEYKIPRTVFRVRGLSKSALDLGKGYQPEPTQVTPHFPIGAKLHKVTNSATGEVREMMLTPDKAAQFNQEGFQAVPEVTH